MAELPSQLNHLEKYIICQVFVNSLNSQTIYELQ